MQLCNIWIFDVGRGFVSAIRTPAGKWIMIDLGASSDFNPVTDFMLKKLLVTNQEKKRPISQLLITHPHNDHLTAIEEFDKHIWPSLLTVPNDINHKNQPPKGKINWDLVTNQSDELTNYLREKMFPRRAPPLRATMDDQSDGFYFKIYYLLPGICEEDPELLKANYTNNLSIMARLNYKGKVILFCGDMMKDGMSKILEHDHPKTALKNYGVDFLIAPHHGLRSSFSTELFAAMKGGKTRGLNIICERQTRKSSNEIVDERYGHRDYSLGHDVVINGEKVRKRKIRTSVVGHIRITIYDNKRCRIVAGPNALL